MRVLHVPYTFYPDPTGGTEIYVEQLATWQRSLGFDCAIAAPGTTTSYIHAGLPVWRFDVSPNLSLRDLYGCGDKIAANGFSWILDEFKPDVVHLHAMTSAISVRLAEQAVNRGVPVILNYHTPTVSCSRGTLLRWGSTICDGKLNRPACTACALEGHGLARPLAKLIGSLPVGVSRGIGNANLSGGKWTALRMPELIGLRIQSFHRMMQMVERVIALCNWTRELLIRNGVPDHKITLCRQGISWPQNVTDAREPRLSRLPLKAAFFGRFDATKGVDVVVRALKSDPALPVQLDLYGVRQGEAGNRYAADLKTMISIDPRIRILPPLPSAEVFPSIRDYDLVVVPSQGLETGPLVVLEAFAAGVPVLGSNLGGIEELITNGVDGLLVQPAASPEAWTSLFRRVCADPDLLTSIRSRIRPPRHTRDTALDLMPVYAAAVSGKERISLRA